MLNDNYIIEKFSNKALTPHLLKNISEEEKNYLNNRFSDSLSIKESIFRIINNIEIRPVCLTCGKPVEFLARKYRPYKLYCCAECVSNSPIIREKVKQTCLERYGVENPNQSKEIKEKAKQTCLKRYNVEYSWQAKEIKEKAKQTCLERYGVENPAQAKEIKEKAKQTCLKRYNVEYSWQAKEIKEKAKQTCLKKYNDFNYNNREKAKQTCLERYGVENPHQNENFKEKAKQTCLERYGVENPSQSELIKEKKKQTCLKNYGVTNGYLIPSVLEQSNNEESKRKRYNTHKKNNSFNVSKPENEYYNYLISIYGKDNIIRNYYSDEYPFKCDFYIINENKYIEYQGNWTHGKHPFDPNSEEDINKLNLWKSKEGKYYKNAIYTWTDLDVRKRKIAKENKLNFEEVWPNIKK